jgi:hypothetical protein
MIGLLLREEPEQYLLKPVPLLRLKLRIKGSMKPVPDAEVSIQTLRYLLINHISDVLIANYMLNIEMMIWPILV